MKKIASYLILFVACLTMQAQSTVLPMRQRMDVKAQRQALRPVSELQSVSVRCADAESLAAAIRQAGYHAKALRQDLLTAVVPAGYLRHTLSTDHRVSRISGSYRKHFFMDAARKDIGVETIRSSDEFETPFTGKGVLVAMIDGGFKYDHIAFCDADDQSRIKLVWNRKDWADGADGEPTTTIPTGNDGYDMAGGHGTHTAGIAAGSVIEQNNYSGIAPEADIMMISSSMDNAEVMEDLMFIDEYARERQQPYVVNMSFGQIVGSHDGADEYDLFIDSIASAHAGHALVFAAGNSGSDNIHVTHTFAEDDEQVAIGVKLGEETSIIDLWGSHTDSLNHLTVKAYISATVGLTEPTELTTDDERFFHEIHPFNKRENYAFMPDGSEKSSQYIVFLISGKQGDTFHAWTEEGSTFPKQKFNKLGVTTLQGDSDMSVGGSGTCAKNAFCVANYVTKTTFKSLQYGTIDASKMGVVAKVGEIEFTSSYGPTCNPSLLKPDVAAPGAMIIAPIDFVKKGDEEWGFVVQQVMHNGEENNFMANMGTSMAAPQVTGTMALWLQANPLLTCDQLHQIVRETSRHDASTGAEAWNEHWGYGKLDAYEGLKMALQLADGSGIPTVYGLSEPVSMKKLQGRWCVLFNGAEPWATITVTDINGRQVSSHRLSAIQRGQEETLSFSGLSRGVYVVNIKTAQADLSRKLIVE